LLNQPPRYRRPRNGVREIDHRFSKPRGPFSQIIDRLLLRQSILAYDTLFAVSVPERVLYFVIRHLSFVISSENHLFLAHRRGE
jgi:hypothetical protein